MLYVSFHKICLLTHILATSDVAFTAYSIADVYYNPGDVLQFPEVLTNYMGAYDASDGEDLSLSLTLMLDGKYTSSMNCGIGARVDHSIKSGWIWLVEC